MAGDLPEAFLGDRTIPRQPLSHAFDPTGPTLLQRWPCSAAPAGLLIFTLSIPPFFSNPHLKRQCGGFYVINFPFPLLFVQRQEQQSRPSWWERRRRSIWAGSRPKGVESANSIKSVGEGPSSVEHLLRMFGLLTFDLPLVDTAFLVPCICVSECVCLCHCVPAYATVPKYICFSGSCQSMATFFCTPTVACGTVIFVNAMLVTFRKSPEQSGPNKHRHGWFRLFFTLFSVQWNPDPKAVFIHYQIRNEYEKPI